MNEIVILDLLSTDYFSDDKMKGIENSFKSVEPRLNYRYKNQPKDLTFRNFLSVLGMNGRMYYLDTIRLKKPAVFVKRNDNSIKLNAYNKNILALFLSNMDISQGDRLTTKTNHRTESTRISSKS